MKESKIDKVLISKLQSEKSSTILEALRDIKVSGSVTIIPYLFDIIAQGKEDIIIDEILRIISDIKEKDAVPVIVDSIKRQNYGIRTADVLAICWQSNLDFSPFIHDFITIFIHSNYQASIEVFSVIEESIYQTPAAKRQECLKILESKVNDITSDKKLLYNELVKVLKASLNLTIDN